MSAPSDLSEQYQQVAEQWSPELRKAVVDYWTSEAQREKIKTRYADITDLACAVDPTYVVTPALKLIGRDIELVLSRPRHNLVVTTPPQEGKSMACSVYTPLRGLQLDPNRRIALVTYADQLAADHSLMCRQLIDSHGGGVVDPLTGTSIEDKLGYRLATGQNKINRWKLAGSRGGMIAVGIGGPLTGRPVDLLIIDDPFKNQMEADSINHRRKVLEWFNAVGQTRLSPKASIILIQTRWHPEDLAGTVIADTLATATQFKKWRYINIPAISEEGIPDSLERPPGVVLQSARGRTMQEFEDTRRAVGERVWYAMYQGSPRNPAGGLFARAWFEPHADAPLNPVATIVGIDPADTGENDDTGIVAAALAQDGTAVFTEDWSGPFTSDQWSRRAVTLALTVNAREIAMEAYATATTYEAVIKRAYRAIHTDAINKQASGVELTDIEKRALSEQPPFTIYKWRAGARVDAVGRSALLRQALETRRARTVENKLAAFEDDAADWQIGQHQPDRVSAAIIAYDRIAALVGGQMTVAAPVNRPPPGRDSRANAVTPIGLNPLARRLGRR